ncbi:MAG: hypothetical protein M1826_005890 [Phylliscum demangeonii]|nr:MAG: hypothetical protein M1826_005890 [Phylliscum demangeonii]
MPPTSDDYVCRHAHDAALAHEELPEKYPRLRALEKVAEEPADLKAAAMTSTAQLANEKARFHKQDQELQLALCSSRPIACADACPVVGGLRNQLRAAGKQVEDFKGKDSEEAAASKLELLAEENSCNEVAQEGARLEATAFLSRTFELIIDRPTGVDNRRVQHLETSRGRHMLLVTGIIAGHNTPEEQTLHAGALGTGVDLAGQAGRGGRDGTVLAALIIDDVVHTRPWNSIDDMESDSVEAIDEAMLTRRKHFQPAPPQISGRTPPGAP